MRLNNRSISHLSLFNSLEPPRQLPVSSCNVQCIMYRGHNIMIGIMNHTYTICTWLPLIVMSMNGTVAVVYQEYYFRKVDGLNIVPTSVSRIVEINNDDQSNYHSVKIDLIQNNVYCIAVVL